MSIVVEICNFNDERLKNALLGLSRQDMIPGRVLIADGGSPPSYVERMKDFCMHDPEVSKLNIEWKMFPGTPLETREASIDSLAEDITVFLDSDEVPTPAWLRSITAPIAEGKADFTGGPMISEPAESNYITDYYREIENRIYQSDVIVDVNYMPLGNTAWKTTILKRFRFDMRLAKSCGEAEDYDLEMRATDAGFKGKYVSGAAVKHYQSYPKTFFSLLGRRYQYLLGASIVLIKNGRLARRIGEKRARIHHPFGVIEAMLRPVALFHGFVRWHLFPRQ